jgi:hypothetical protein
MQDANNNNENPKRKSNLSETAKFVKNVMDEVVMPEIDERGIAVEAKEIILKQVAPESPQMMEFESHVDELQDACLQRISPDDPEKDKKAIVGKNFCSKLKRSVRG